MLDAIDLPAAFDYVIQLFLVEPYDVVIDILKIGRSGGQILSDCELRHV